MTTSGSNQATAKKGKQMLSKSKNAPGMSLIDRCRLQMSSSMLRTMDEVLYSNEAESAPFDREKFVRYHDAYEAVCANWPIKPIDFVVNYIGRRSFRNATSVTNLNNLVYADIGCGREPLLKHKLTAKNVINDSTIVHSFDLVSAHDGVVAANMKNLPLKEDLVDVCVFSLSLMARDLGKILLEAKRVMKLKGQLLIAEVTSRFMGRERRFIEQVLTLGFELRKVETLPPNNYFTFFHFTKSDNKLSYKNRDLRIKLKPCLYKAR